MSDSGASAEMDLNEFESSEHELPVPKRRKLDPLDRVAYVRSLASVELQRFIDEPPGEGMAVIYVFVNLKDGKVYVGKHEHADGGKSFKATRCQRHLKPIPSARKTYFVNAMRKHGKESFEYHIIWHGPESEVDDQERLWIGPTGLHTIKDNGGWGYNTREGGEGGRFAPSVVAKLKAARSKPEYKAATSERSKAQFASPEARAELSKRSKAQRAKETPEERTEWNRKISETLSTPEAKEASSERGKKQAAREAAEGKPSLGERGKVTQTGNWTDEQRAVALAKKAATDAKKRAYKLSTLSGVALERKKKEYERTDRKGMIRKAKADALLKLDKYAGMNYTWRQENLSKVQKEDGVHFFPYVNGVLCAAFKTQGEGSSSSS